jgi:hypothetical protein
MPRYGACCLIGSLLAGYTHSTVQAGKPAAPDSTAKPAAPSLPAGHIKVLDDDDDFPKHADAPAKKASAAPTQRKVCARLAALCRQRCECLGSVNFAM